MRQKVYQKAYRGQGYYIAMPSTIPTASNETELLVLVDSLLEIFERSSSTSSTSVPLLALDSCLELLTFYSRIPFEAFQRPIIKNGFLQCCKVVEQSSMTISSHISQAATTIDFYFNTCHVAKTTAEKEAWRVAEESGIDLVVVNPSFVVGPLLAPKPTSTLQFILDTVKGCTHQ